MNPVARIDMLKAAYTIEKLNPAIEALSQINAQSLDYCTNTMAEVESITALLHNKMAEAHDTIERGKEQYQNRDQSLITKATDRYFKIDGEIEAESRKKESTINLYTTKFNELKQKGFSNDEIDRIIIRPDDEIAAFDTAIDELKNEKLKVQKFLADAPRYNPVLLAGTNIITGHHLKK